MPRDARHQQIIHKFSFIESLNLSQKKRHNPQANSSGLNQPNVDRAFSFQHKNTASNRTLSTKSDSQASAIVRTSDVSSTISADWYQANSSGYGLSLAEIINYPPNNAPDNSTEHISPKRHSYLGKVLFALASSYCLFVLWWLFGHQGNRVLTMLTGAKQIVLSKSDVQFIDYMGRSLDNIDRQLEAERVASGKDEVVYVPVYTPAPATPPAPLAVSSSIPAVTQPEPVPQALKIPAPPPLPAATPIEQNQVAIASKPAISHTLTGILELGGGKSAALVKVQGKTRRVWLGEEINSEGWILQSVGNQRANISYQGQVKSISVGETF